MSPCNYIFYEYTFDLFANLVPENGRNLGVSVKTIKELKRVIFRNDSWKLSIFVEELHSVGKQT